MIRARSMSMALVLALVAVGHAAGDDAKKAQKPLTLDNGLEVFLVSDPSLDRAAAGLSVESGSYDDGDLPGIAHFLEHMLFLGTKTYPDPGAYQDYLSQNGGHSNAYTADNHTNYFFEVKPEAFEGALDRFSRFFIDPLMTDALSEREVNAVDSEHSKNLEDDFWRARQVYHSLLNPKHPLHGFSTGNKQTLAKVQNTALREHHAKHYSANVMHLAIVAPAPLATLEGWARAKFAAIENKKLTATTPTEPLFGEAIRGRRVDVKTLKDLRELWVRFEMPSAAFDVEAKPGHILGSVIGHEGEESLLQQLKSEGLAEGLSAGADGTQKQGTFNITVSLTKAGLADVDRVLELTFGLLNHLRAMKELPAYVTSEAQKMAAIELRFRQLGSVGGEAQGLAAAMIEAPHERLYEAMYLIEKPDAVKVRAALDALVPANLSVMVLTRKAETDAKEEHYGTDYAVKPLGEPLLARLAAAKPEGKMAVPAENPFIPSDFDLVKPAHAAAPWTHRFEQGELWLRHDTQFLLPKVAVHIEVMNGLHQASARDYVLGDLFAAAVNEALNPYAYPMGLAGMNVRVSSDRGGLAIDAGGYSHKLSELLAFVTPFLTEVRIDEKKLAIIKDSATRNLLNKVLQPASAHAFEYFREIGRQVHWNDAAQLEVLKTVGYEDLKDYAKRVHEAIYIRGFVYGNLTEAVVTKLAQDLVTRLKPSRVLAEADRFTPRILKLKKDTAAIVRKEIQGNDSAAVLILQHDPLSDDSRAAMQVLAPMLENRFFQDLRTLQQVGYIVGAGAMDVESLPIFFLLAQSSVVSTESLRGRFESFLKHVVEDLDDVSEADFQKGRESAIAHVREKRTTFAEELAWNVRAAFELRGDFAFEDRQVAALEALTKERWYAWVSRFFAEEGARRISIEVVGKKDRQKFQESTIEMLRKERNDGFWERPRVETPATEEKKAAADGK